MHRCFMPFIPSRSQLDFVKETKVLEEIYLAHEFAVRVSHAAAEYAANSGCGRIATQTWPNWNGQMILQHGLQASKHEIHRLSM